jgi:membrane protease YdiL (CAAX protease family)
VGVAYGGRVTRALPPADYPGCPVTVTEAVEAGRVLRPPRWGLWDVFWTVIAAVFLGTAAAGLLLAVDAPLWAVVIIGTSVPWIAFGGWPLVVTGWRGNGPRIDLGLRLTWSDAGWGLLAGIGSIILAAVAAAITQAFVPDLSSAAGDAADELVANSSRLAVSVFALMVMIGAPVVEELFFRGLFFGALRKRGLGTVMTVLITAVLFAGFHFEPLRLLVLLPTGLLLGWVRAKTGSTGASMVAHGIVNAPGAILLLLGGPGMSP